jgi:predicted CopG family antitoxin
MVETRTVKVHLDTYERLQKLKVHPRETLDDVIKRLLEKEA